jgi:maltose-binding protein MalE
MKLRLFFSLVSIVFLFTGCTFGTSQESTETQNPTIDFPSRTITLNIWLPKEFDPNDGSDAANLFTERLDNFSTRRPGVQVEIRIKNLQGPGSLLETLSATKEAAPLALPDLIALPYDQMLTAASQNLIYPLDSYISDVGSEDWYDFALDLGQYQGKKYGIPFAANMLVMAYHPTIVGDPPSTWEEMINREATLAFPASEPDAIFTLALYQSLGGEILNENGILQLDRNLLESVFDLYHQAIVADVMPDWSIEISSDDDTWGNFIKNQSQLAITWTDHFFEPSSGGVNFTAIPTTDGTPYTYSNGWVWV